jgi:RNase P/RNase MRP subunit p29
MHKPAEYIVLGVLLLGICSGTTFGQTEVKTIHLRDGTIIQGRILAQDDSTLVVETKYGTLDIQKRNVLSQESSIQTPGKSTAPGTETIHLKDGTIIRGIIVSEGTDSLTVDTMYGSIKIPKSTIEQPSSEPLRGAARVAPIDSFPTDRLQADRIETTAKAVNRGRIFTIDSKVIEGQYIVIGKDSVEYYVKGSGFRRIIGLNQVSEIQEYHGDHGLTGSIIGTAVGCVVGLAYSLSNPEKGTIGYGMFEVEVDTYPEWPIYVFGIPAGLMGYAIGVSSEDWDTVYEKSTTP